MRDDSMAGRLALIVMATLALQACAVGEDAAKPGAEEPKVVSPPIETPVAAEPVIPIERLARYRCDARRDVQVTYRGDLAQAFDQATVVLDGRALVLAAANNGVVAHYAGEQGSGMYRWSGDGQTFHLTVQAQDRVAKEVDVFSNCQLQQG